MTYEVIITAVSLDGTRRSQAFRASRIEREHLAGIIEHIMPLYNPLGHEILIMPNITKEEGKEQT